MLWEYVFYNALGICFYNALGLYFFVVLNIMRIQLNATNTVCKEIKFLALD